jgi:amino acid permease
MERPRFPYLSLSILLSFSLSHTNTTRRFAFTCQVNVFSIYEELERSSAKRMSRVSNGAVRLCMFAYLLMGLFGYLDYGAATQANILQNYCVQKTKDPLMITAFVGIVITIVMAFPLNIFPCRYTMEIIIER